MSAGLITLIIYIVVLVPLMLLGFYFARRKMFDPHHKLTMTLVLILNWVLIGVVMINSYAPIAAELPDNLDQSFALIPTIHGSVGLIAQLMATYLVLLMWTENTPLERIVIFRIKNIKTPMRITLTLWLITVILGFGVYGVWYGSPTTADTAPPPATTEEAESGLPDPDTTEEASEDVPEPDATEAVEDDSEDVPEPDATEAVEDDSEDVPEPDTTEEAD